MQHFQTEILSRMTCLALKQQHTEQLAKAVLDYFVVNACILDGLSPAGRLMLTADLTHVSELPCNTLLSPFTPPARWRCLWNRW